MMKKIFVLLLCLFLYACSEKVPVLHRTDAEEVFSHVTEYGLQETGRVGDAEWTGVNFYGNVERADYLVSFIVSKDHQVMDMVISAEGRVDREFLYDLCSLLVKHEWAKERIEADLRKVLDNEAGGKISFRNDSLILEGDISISKVSLELKDLHFTEWYLERTAHE